ncbi:MAG: hypothetical protein PWQ57_3231 [Desulfovibrionales bacterium]|jgi:uncharacterized SAM-binding protein YcdF (DUF218 family)|nr:hypothetical protein [Desulfovibrionales bacterium]
MEQSVRRLAAILLQLLGALSLLGVLAAALLFFFAPKILQVRDAPVPAHAIVSLGGDYSRPLYAADLYNEGYAPKILVSRVEPMPIRPKLEELGIFPPTQTDITVEILRRKGVPDQDILPFGDKLTSTRDEARALRQALGDAPVTLLVVTSPYHTRRAKIVLQKALPKANILVLASPYESFPEDWWRRHRLALNVLQEAAKTVYYALGLDFGYESNKQAPAPHAD